jgi:RimJ/RimL family protein N-acetyltransferase
MTSRHAVALAAAPSWALTSPPPKPPVSGLCKTGVFPENTASLALHERSGFRTVGCRERIGVHHGVWRDVTMIERRSAVTGT